jgi:hypothetical protein
MWKWRVRNHWTCGFFASANPVHLPKRTVVATHVVFVCLLGLFSKQISTARMHALTVMPLVWGWQAGGSTQNLLVWADLYAPYLPGTFSSRPVNKTPTQVLQLLERLAKSHEELDASASKRLAALEGELPVGGRLLP